MIKSRKNHEYIVILFYYTWFMCSWNKHGMQHYLHNILFFFLRAVSLILHKYILCALEITTIYFFIPYGYYINYVILYYIIFFIFCFHVFFKQILQIDLNIYNKILEILEIYLFINIYIYTFILQIFLKIFF